MSETQVVIDRHFAVPLTDEELMEVKLKAIRAQTTRKDWVRQAIIEKLKEE